jgi:outer membrane protein assembly factor BamB
MKSANVTLSIIILSLTLLLGGHQLACASEPQVQAQQILEATAVKGGLIVHIGCGDGKLTAALRANDSFLVHGLDVDAKKVEKACDYIKSLNIYGKVTVEQFRAKRLPYTDNLVNLIISENLGKVLMNEVMRVLAPDGTAYIKKRGKWVKTVKPRPKEIDEWTHFLHDATNNAVAHDSVVGPPYHLQWVGEPKWARSHDHLASISAVVSSGGRIFYIVDEGSIASVVLPAKWFLVARDAFNGIILWKRPIGPWEGHLRGFRSGPTELPRRLVAVNDRVYVTLGYDKPVSALEAATGEIVKTYEGTDNALEIIYHEGILFMVAGERAAEKAEAAAVAWRRGVTPSAHNKHLLAIKADTGELAWKKSGPETAELMPTTLAVNEGRVFFQNPAEIICLDVANGREIWRAGRPVSHKRLGWSTPTLVVCDDVVLSADRQVPAQAQKDAGTVKEVEWEPNSKGGDAPVGELIAFSAKTGQRLWDCQCRECYNSSVDVLVTGGLVWTGDLVRSKDPGITVARDLATGEISRRRPPDKEFFAAGMGHHRCYRNKATDQYLLLGRAGVEFVDVDSGKAIPNHWVRGTCQYGIIPCNGLLYAPSHSCACFIRAKLNGFNALARRRKPKPGRPNISGRGRLERGPAYATIKNRKTTIENLSDWPTYRHDAARSGCTRSPVPTALKRMWRSQLGGKLTSPVIADGKVFVASVDTHTIHALDTNNGRVLWSYTANGRVDSPPTIYKGLVLFGSADGRVYCLDASDGGLVWRFRAGPEDRRLVAYGQVESVWPIHGSVLVQDGVTYFAAGRSSYLDGGIYLYRLKARTGKMLSETRIDSRDPNTGIQPKGIIRGTDMPGALPDVLSSDGTSIYMRHKRFDRQGIELEPNVPHLFSSVGILDSSWWHRTYWMVGTKMGCDYGGWPRMGNVVPSGRLLVFDGSNIYGFGRDSYAHHGSHVGLDATTIFHFRPNRDTATRYTHYRLFGTSRDKLQSKPDRRGKSDRPLERNRWSQRAPLVVLAMVLADKTLFLAGPRDSGSEGPDVLTALEADEGGLLCAFSPEDGNKLAEYEIESQPVFDGMAAANGRLYLATNDGKISCFGKQ